MVVITLLRGFKVRLSTLDAFLATNGIPEEHERLCTGSPPFYDDESDKVTVLLRRKAGGKTRLFMPFRSSFNESFTACIAYDWIWAFAQRRLKPEEMALDPPADFEELRKEILSHGDSGELDDEEFGTGVFIVVTDERGWVPPELGDRYRNIKCDQCNMTFEDGRWNERQLHRQEVHGSREGLNPLPEDS